MHEHAHDEIERVIGEVLQVGGVAFLKRAMGQAVILCAPVAGCHQVLGDVDTEHIGPTRRLRQCRRAVAAPEIQDLQSAGDAKPGN